MSFASLLIMVIVIASISYVHTSAKPYFLSVLVLMRDEVESILEFVQVNLGDVLGTCKFFPRDLESTRSSLI